MRPWEKGKEKRLIDKKNSMRFFLLILALCFCYRYSSWNCYANKKKNRKTAVEYFTRQWRWKDMQKMKMWVCACRQNKFTKQKFKQQKYFSGTLFLSLVLSNIVLCEFFFYFKGLNQLRMRKNNSFFILSCSFYFDVCLPLDFL